MLASLSLFVQLTVEYIHTQILACSLLLNIKCCFSFLAKSVSINSVYKYQ